MPSGATHTAAFSSPRPRDATLAPPTTRANPCHQAVTAATAPVPSSRPSRAAAAAAALLGFPAAEAAPSRADRAGLPTPPRTAQVRTSSGSLTGIGRSRSAPLPIRRSPARSRRARGPKRRANCTPRRSHCRRSRTAAPCSIARGSSISRRAAAANACTKLNRRQLPCVVVQPSRS